MITIKFDEYAIGTNGLNKLLDALYILEDELGYKGSVSTSINQIQQVLDKRKRQSPPTLNGVRIRYFHYNEGAQELEVYDKHDRVISTIEMSPQQWKKISTGSYARCWNNLVELFADPIEEV